MPTIWAFDSIENKHTFYCGEDCAKKFCTFLTEHATNVINFGRKKNITDNKRRAKIVPRGKSMSYLWKKNL